MIRLSRRVFLAAPAVLGAASARAQGVLPARGVRIIIGYPVGGGTDEMARVIAAALQQRLSRPVTIENRPGAAGAAVGEILKKAPTDGSVLGFIPTATLVGRLTTKSFPFDPQTDLMPLTLAGTYPTGLAVSRKIDVSSLADYGKWLQSAGPEGARFGTTSLQSFTHFFGLMVGRALSQQLEAVYYKGASPMIADLEQGRIPAATSGLTSLLQHHRGSRLRILVSSGQSAQQDRPGIPTVVELGYPALELQTGTPSSGRRPVGRRGGGLGTRAARHGRFARHDRDPDPARSRRRDIDRRAMRQATGSRHGALAVDP